MGNPRPDGQGSSSHPVRGGGGLAPANGSVALCVTHAGVSGSMSIARSGNPMHANHWGSDGSVAGVRGFDQLLGVTQRVRGHPLSRKHSSDLAGPFRSRKLLDGGDGPALFRPLLDVVVMIG